MEILAKFVLALLLGLSLTGSPTPAGATRHRVVYTDDAYSIVSYMKGRHYRHYLVLGDSITCGTGTPGLHGGYAEQARVRTLCAGGTGWSDQLGSTSFRNSLMKGLPVLRNRPRTLIFHYGINDLAFGITAADLISRVRNIRHELRLRGYRVVLGTVIPSPATSPWTTDKGIFNPDGTTVQQNRLLFNRWIRHHGPYVDYAKALECGRAKVQCPGLTNQNDAHVNVKGAARMARVLLAWLADDSRRHR